MSKKVFNIIVAVILIVGGLVGIYLWKNLSPRPVFSEGKVEQGNIREAIQVSGKVAPVSVADLGFESGGKVITLTHQIGDQVKAGELLAEANNEDVRAQLAGASAERNGAEALLSEDKQLVSKEKYKLKSLDHTSTANSNDKKSQKSQVNAQEALVEYQEAQVSAANYNINFINSQLKMTRIYAPFAGVVSRQDAKLGEVAQSNVPFMKVISQDNFQLEAFVSELDAKNIQVGDKATITTAGNQPNSFEAEVLQVYPAENDVNGVSNYKIILNIPSGITNLKSGMEANISITTQEKSNVLLIPQKAVFQEGGKKFVYVINGAVRSKQEVKTGIFGDNAMVEIVSGLKAGDNILIVENK